ncbi:MAG: hypothetical protein ACF788_10885 [Novipirellula sp. JB048]
MRLAHRTRLAHTASSRPAEPTANPALQVRPTTPNEGRRFAPLANLPHPAAAPHLDYRETPTTI